MRSLIYIGMVFGWLSLFADSTSVSFKPVPLVKIADGKLPDVYAEILKHYQIKAESSENEPWWQLRYDSLKSIELIIQKQEISTLDELLLVDRVIRTIYRNSEDYQNQKSALWEKSFGGISGEKEVYVAILGIINANQPDQNPQNPDSLTSDSQGDGKLTGGEGAANPIQDNNSTESESLLPYLNLSLMLLLIIWLVFDKCESLKKSAPDEQLFEDIQKISDSNKEEIAKLSNQYQGEISKLRNDIEKLEQAQAKKQEVKERDSRTSTRIGGQYSGEEYSSKQQQFDRRSGANKQKIYLSHARQDRVIADDRKEKDAYRAYYLLVWDGHSPSAEIKMNDQNEPAMSKVYSLDEEALLYVCEAINQREPKSKKVMTHKAGTAVLDGDAWRIKEKVKIKYV